MFRCFSRRDDFSVGDLTRLRGVDLAISQLRLSVDGAKRGNEQSAAGMAITAYHLDDSPLVVFKAGRYLGHLTSAFDAELLALQWGLSLFCNFVNESL